MKIIREYLYENFSEDSDPIEDMNIGFKATVKMFVKEMNISETGYVATYCLIYKKPEYAKFIIETNMYDCRDTEDINNAYCKAAELGYLDVMKVIEKYTTDAVRSVNDYALRYAIKNKHYNIVKHLITKFKYQYPKWNFYRNREIHIYSEYVMLFDEYLKLFTKVFGARKKGSLHERFQEETDPIHDMGIGLPQFCFEFGKALEDTVKELNRLSYISVSNINWQSLKKVVLKVNCERKDHKKISAIINKHGLHNFVEDYVDFLEIDKFSYNVLLTPKTEYVTFFKKTKLRYVIVDTEPEIIVYPIDRNI